MSSQITSSSSSTTAFDTGETAVPFPPHTLTATPAAAASAGAASAGAASEPAPTLLMPFRRHRRNALVLSDEPGLISTLAAAFGSARPDSPPEEELGAWRLATTKRFKLCLLSYRNIPFVFNVFPVLSCTKECARCLRKWWLPNAVRGAGAGAALISRRWTKGRERSDVTITKTWLSPINVHIFLSGRSIASPPTPRAQPGPPPSLRSHACPTPFTFGRHASPPRSVRLFPPFGTIVRIAMTYFISCCNVSNGCETSEEELGE